MSDTQSIRLDAEADELEYMLEQAELKAEQENEWPMPDPRD